MKTTIFRMAVLPLLAVSLAACDGCNKKKDAAVPAYSTTDYKEVDTANVDNAQIATEPESANANAPQTQTRKSTPAKSKATTDDKSGYSAADGTDAENHDGDQYTKNNEKPMPSGPPIK